MSAARTIAAAARAVARDKAVRGVAATAAARAATRAEPPRVDDLELRADLRDFDERLAKAPPPPPERPPRRLRRRA